MQTKQTTTIMMIFHIKKRQKNEMFNGDNNDQNNLYVNFNSREKKKKRKKTMYTQNKTNTHICLRIRKRKNIDPKRELYVMII
jgi:hypothetical protein